MFVKPDRFPVMLNNYTAVHVLWAVAEEAWGVYSERYGTRQSVARLAERGGFGESEMDLYRPGWRDLVLQEVRHA